MVTTEEKLEALETLYEKTGVDWNLTIDICLTEPVCITAMVAPEDNKDYSRYRVDKDTIMDAYHAAIDLVYREMILGETITPECPFTIDSKIESA